MRSIEDIVDLSGVRVALYFPAEREEVGRIIKSLFVPVVEPKEFPTPGQPTYEKRFSGYWATHYRVRLPEILLNESQKRYAEARIEIQVASVLMHVWSEVEHDLVYKPLQGQLSEEEYAILDELNGLALAGEVALERLPRAGVFLAVLLHLLSWVSVTRLKRCPACTQSFYGCASNYTVVDGV